MSAERASWYASELRRELGLRNRLWARGRAHVESCGNPPVIVYAPYQPTGEGLPMGTPAKDERHGNFFDAAYATIAGRPDWMRRFNKIHAQKRALPKAERKWREARFVDESDALLMNVFCTPGVAEAPQVRRTLGVDVEDAPLFGWKARVPLASGLLDRTEVDMRWGGLLVEAKLTEGDFQTRAAAVVEGYRDFDAVFERELLPRVELRTGRRKEAAEFPEDYSQEAEDIPDQARLLLGLSSRPFPPRAFSSKCEHGYAGYQLIRNVLAAYAEGSSFCVIHDQRRPDLREAWFQVMAAVKSAEMRVRCKALTWQELAALLPVELQEFLIGNTGLWDREKRPRRWSKEPPSTQMGPGCCRFPPLLRVFSALFTGESMSNK